MIRKLLRFLRLYRFAHSRKYHTEIIRKLARGTNYYISSNTNLKCSTDYNIQIECYIKAMIYWQARSILKLTNTEYIGNVVDKNIVLPTETFNQLRMKYVDYLFNIKTRCITRHGLSRREIMFIDNKFNSLRNDVVSPFHASINNCILEFYPTELANSMANLLYRLVNTTSDIDMSDLNHILNAIRYMDDINLFCYVAEYFEPYKYIHTA